MENNAENTEPEENQEIAEETSAASFIMQKRKEVRLWKEKLLNIVKKLLMKCGLK